MTITTRRRRSLAKVEAGQALGFASPALIGLALFTIVPVGLSIVMSVFAAVWYALGLNNRLNAWTGVGLSMILSAAAAIVVYRFFEAPVTRALQTYAPGMKTTRVPAE